MAISPAPIQEMVASDKGFISRMWAMWFDLIRREIHKAPTYLKANLPTNVEAGSLAYVPNETGGTVIAFYDGTNWRRVTDRAIVS